MTEEHTQQTTEQQTTETLAQEYPREPFGFDGSGAEYFRIWIVNLFLSIITIGIYSPWAKVRNTRYLYRNTQVAGASFDYHANPVAILKGRLIAVVLLAIYLGSGAIFPGLDLLVFLLIGGFVPWLLVRSRMFALRNTSYRNIRFSFQSVFSKAYKVLIGYYLIVAVTLGMAYPWARYHRARLLVDNSSFGDTSVQMDPWVTPSDFYKIYMVIGVLAMGVAFFASQLLGWLGPMLVPEGALEAGDPENPELSPAMMTVLFLTLLIMFPIYASAYFALKAAVLRKTLHNLHVGEHRILCDFSIARLVGVYLSNLVAIFLSLGLLIPWATVRVRRFLLAHLTLQPHGDLNAMLGRNEDEVSALGEEVGEIFDFDFGL